MPILYPKPYTLNPSRGFTLIELLVALSMIAVISTIVFSLFTSVTAKSRDSKRKSDLQAIARSLEIYFQKNGKYPDAAGIGNWSYSSGLTPWIPGMTAGYIESMPKDPKDNSGQPWTGGFGYAYKTASASECSNAGNQFFILVAHLERSDDSERLGAKKVLWCDGTSLDTNATVFDGGSGTAYPLFVITAP